MISIYCIPKLVDKLNIYLDSFTIHLKLSPLKISVQHISIFWSHIICLVGVTHCVADTSWSRLSDTFTVSTAAPLTQELPSLPLLSRGSNRALFSLQSGVIEVWISPPKQSLHGPWLLSCRHKYLRVWALKTTFYPLQSCSCFLTLLSTRTMWIFMFVLELNMFTHTLSCKWRISSTLV